MTTDDERGTDQGEEFRDPTAPPPLPDSGATEPLGAPGPPTPARPSPDQPPAPYSAPPAGAPYGAPPPPPYARPVPPPAASPYPYATAPAGLSSPTSNASALVLTIVSAVALAFCGGVLVIPALVLGVVGLAKQSTDPQGSQRMSRWGWWAFAVGVVLSILTVVAVFAFLFFVRGSSYGSY